MLTDDDGRPAQAPPPGYPIDFPRDGILVDDRGHGRDLLAAVEAVLAAVYPDEVGEVLEQLATWVGAPGGDLRAWFARSFFAEHIKRYSMSRRKAPIYWQLATPSASYSVWLYLHRLTPDTLYRVLNDYVVPKLQHEERKLVALAQEVGLTPSARQRKELEAQAHFVAELRAFKEEVARVAPLWNPHLDDGVLINFAPLWRLVPHHRAWQKECKETWDKLVKGAYDWSHLAMHLWPERVVPKCLRDRSLAIAHGVFEQGSGYGVQGSGGGQGSGYRVQGSGGRQGSGYGVQGSGGGQGSGYGVQGSGGVGEGAGTPSLEARVEALVAERTSPAVKAALERLLAAPAPGGAPRRRRRRARAAGGAGAARPSRTPRGRATVDPRTLEAVRDAIAAAPHGAAKADVLRATGIDDSAWNAAIRALLDQGVVTKTGARRGTRYHIRRGE